MNIYTYIIVGVVAVSLLLFGYLAIKPTYLGGLIHNIAEHFIGGIIIGSAESPACIKVMDTDKGGWSYITYLNGVETVTGGNPALVQGVITGYQWSIPDACVGK